MKIKYTDATLLDLLWSAQTQGGTLSEKPPSGWIRAVREGTDCPSDYEVLRPLVTPRERGEISGFGELCPEGLAGCCMTCWNRKIKELLEDGQSTSGGSV